MQSSNRSRTSLSWVTASLVSACVALLHAPALFAQIPKNLPPDVAVELARSPKPPLSNEVVGVAIDRFVGSPLLSPVHVTQGGIFTRAILTHGDPYHAGNPGAVLEYRKDLSLGTILGYCSTPLVPVPEEQFWYVESGKGRLDNDDEYWDLHEGIGVLIPPNARHRVTNISAEPLQMLMLTWTPFDVTPRAGMLVRDVNTLPLPAQGAHWNYFGADLFVPNDGLHPNEQIAVVYMPPMTIAEPHAHIPHWEEIWVKLPPYRSYLMLGSEVREMPPNTALLAPPNSQTVHSVVNLMTDKMQAWLLMSHWTWKQGPHPERPFVKPQPLNNLH